MCLVFTVDVVSYKSDDN